MSHPVRLGFVALNDSAPLVIAKERGHFRRHGVEVELVREPSWANVRDRPVLAERVVDLPDFHVFHRHAATFPWVSHAMWYATQMIRWGQVEKPFCVRSLAGEVYRPDLYREAARQIGEPVPERNEKSEGRHEHPWVLEQASPRLAMRPDRFLDGRCFEPDDVVAYLEQSDVTRLRLRLDDLATWNA